MSLYEEMKGWQSGIGSSLGFLALMIGALWNFHLNRKRDAALRQEEIVSIAAALYGEIALLRVEAADLARVVANVSIAIGTSPNPIVKFDSHFLAAHQISEATIYPDLANKLGLLPPELVIAITQFHNSIRRVRTGLPLLVDDPTRGYVYGAGRVLIPARDAVFDIIPAMRTIERMAKIPAQKVELDLGQAEEAIAMEEGFHSN
jgi:hypothetical protein